MDDAASFASAGGQDAGDSCLSDRQIKSVEAIDSPVAFGFDLQGGLSSFPRWPILEGGDWTGLFGFGTRPKPANPPEPQKDFGLAVLSDPLIRHMVLRDAAADPLAFDPQAHAGRLRETLRDDRCQSRRSRCLQATWGRLLLMHGTVDSAVPPANTVA
jgi:feruloyl esterase